MNFLFKWIISLTMRPRASSRWGVGGVGVVMKLKTLSKFILCLKLLGSKNETFVLSLPTHHEIISWSLGEMNSDPYIKRLLYNFFTIREISLWVEDGFYKNLLQLCRYQYVLLWWNLMELNTNYVLFYDISVLIRVLTIFWTVCYIKQIIVF